MLNDTYKGKTVLVTGATGFKGSWLCIWLLKLGAKVIGFSSKEWDNTYVFDKAGLTTQIIDIRGDIRDIIKLKEIVEKYKPEIVFHLAAQPIVRTSYDFPLETLSVNMLGTLNVMECIKSYNFLKAGVMITTDKVYKNKEIENGYKEEDELGGYDPYSSSKACSEIIINSYRCSFVQQCKQVASARAGNVVGGGDFSKDRLIPDCIRAIEKGEEIKIRAPHSTRPWQHVVEPLYGYLMLGEKLLLGWGVGTAFNFGPELENIVPVKDIVSKIGPWTDISDKNESKHETIKLSLSIKKAKSILQWKPIWGIDKTLQMTLDWYKRCKSEDVYILCFKQIEEYENEYKKTI